MTTTYQVVHCTDYIYESTVSASYGVVYLLPRDTDWQRVISANMVIAPNPDTYSEHTDFFGNRAAHFSVLDGHTELTVTTTSVVEVAGRPAVPFGSGPTWESARDEIQNSFDADVMEARAFVLESPALSSSPAVRDYAAPSFAFGRPLIDVLGDLTARINGDFVYTSGVTDLTTTLDELLTLRQGVCQDFANLQIACLRAYGIPARYVSGYLETLPPPGQAKLQGSDASHAWLSAFVPSIGWIDVDPTNNLFVGNRHICTAWGRDYADVAPLKGVIYTESKSNTMTVTVDVTSLG